MKRFVSFMAVIGSLFTLVISASGVNGTPFVQSWMNSLPSGSYNTIAVQDLNGDSKPDLVTSDGNVPGTITVATNAGNGIFITNGIYPVGNEPLSVAIADINGDGKPDLIAANSLDNTVTTLTNAGGGIFVSNATYAVGNTPAFVNAMDINGDNKPDLVVANNGDGTLTVLTNAGNGTFSLAQTVLVVNALSSPLSVAVADLNGDNKPDLITDDYNDNLLLVLTNAGGGIFVSNAVYAYTANNPDTITAADVNNDSKTDIIAGRPALIYTNSGNGQLALSQQMPLAGADFTAVDADGDGLIDLWIENNSGVARVIFFNGGGTFITNATQFVVTPSIAPFNYSAATDVNGDGKQDIVAVNSQGFIVLTNDISNIITITVPANITTEAAGPSGAVVDFFSTANSWKGMSPVTNMPPSGSTFPLGITTVTSSTAYFIKSNLTASTNKTFTITVQDTTPPALTLLGANSLTNYINNYIDPGATATDAVWGDLTDSIQISGNLNTNVSGNYTVTYSVTDGSGNNSTTNRTVVLLPLPPLGAASSSAGQTALYWPVTDGNFVVQMTTNLASGNWVTVTSSVPLTGIFVTNSAPAAFFRLQPQ